MKLELEDHDGCDLTGYLKSLLYLTCKENIVMNPALLPTTAYLRKRLWGSNEIIRRNLLLQRGDHTVLKAVLFPSHLCL